MHEKTQSTLNPEHLNILFVGRLVAQKGIHHLLHTLDHYIGAYGDQVRLHLVGQIFHNKNFVKELEELTEKLRLSSYIKIHGKTSFDALATLYRLCDVFLIMSEHEGFCVPIVEAQFHGLPIVALDRGAVGETLGKGQIALSQVDYGLFATAIHRVKNDPTLKENLRKAGHHNLQRFRLKTLNEQFLAAVT